MDLVGKNYLIVKFYIFKYCLGLLKIENYAVIDEDLVGKNYLDCEIL